MPATSMRQNVATAQPDQASSRKRKRDPADQSELEALPSNVSDETRIDECSKSILSGWERGLVKLNDRRRIDKDKKAKKNKKAKKTEEGEGPTRHIICTSPSDYEAALSLRSPLASQLFMTMRWITWYYKACLNYFNYKNRQAKLGESSMGAILINTILNELLGTPEIWTRAFMVLAVFASELANHLHTKTANLYSGRVQSFDSRSTTRGGSSTSDRNCDQLIVRKTETPATRL